MLIDGENVKWVDMWLISLKKENINNGERRKYK